MTGTRVLPRLLFLMLLGCPGCVGDEEDDSQLPSVSTSSAPPTVGRVEIVPDEVMAESGNAYHLVAKAFTATGDFIDLDLHDCLTLEWAADKVGVFADTRANPALVTPPPGAGEVSITATVSAVESDLCANPTMPEPITSGEAVMHTAVALDTSPFDQVYAEKLPDDELVALLIRGQASGATSTQYLGAVGLVNLAKNVDTRSDGISEMIAFAKDRAVVARGPAPTQQAWTSALDVIDADPQPDFGFRQLPIMVGLPPSGSVDATWAADQVKGAAELLNRNRVGIDFDYLGSFTHTSVGVADPTAACTTMNVNSSIGSQPGVNGGAYVLYVLFVDDNLVGLRGWACRPEIELTGLPQHSWTGRAVFISKAEHTEATLAHEIVHVLSLRTGHIDRKHTTDEDGFDSTNLMWGSTTYEQAILRDHLSLGQAYRMNFHPASWLNAEILKYAGDKRITMGCETKMTDSVCPALAADLGG